MVCRKFHDTRISGYSMSWGEDGLVGYLPTFLRHTTPVGVGNERERKRFGRLLFQNPGQLPLVACSTERPRHPSRVPGV